MTRQARWSAKATVQSAQPVGEICNECVDLCKTPFALGQVDRDDGSRWRFELVGSAQHNVTRERSGSRQVRIDGSEVGLMGVLRVESSSDIATDGRKAPGPSAYGELVGLRLGTRRR